VVINDTPCLQLGGVTASGVEPHGACIYES
jgi:hypothetical protein